MPFLCMYSAIIFKHQAKRLWINLSFGNPGEYLICIIFYIPDSQKQQKISIWPFFVVQDSLQGTQTFTWSYPLIFSIFNDTSDLKFQLKNNYRYCFFNINLVSDNTT